MRLCVSPDRPSVRCIPPRIVKYDIDLLSTLPFYDEQGFPKKYAPTRKNADGEWLYALSPVRDQGPLTGPLLAAHFAEIEELKQRVRDERI